MLRSALINNNKIYNLIILLSGLGRKSTSFTGKLMQEFNMLIVSLVNVAYLYGNSKVA